MTRMVCSCSSQPAAAEAGDRGPVASSPSSAALPPVELEVEVELETGGGNSATMFVAG